MADCVKGRRRRPPVPPDLQRTRSIRAYLTDAELDALDAILVRRGGSYSGLAREALLEFIRRNSPAPARKT